MKPTRLIIVAVGGQGNLLASKVLGEAALASGIPMHMSEIHGMAQRGGVVESAIVFGDANSTIISDGDADVLLGFEPLETLRAVRRCNAGTVVVTSTARLSPYTVTTGQGVYPSLPVIRDTIAAKVRQLIAFDAAAIAREAGNILSVNMVLLGALCATNVIPVTADAIEATIREKTKAAFVEVNLKAFALGAAEVDGSPATRRKQP